MLKINIVLRYDYIEYKSHLIVTVIYYYFTVRIKAEHSDKERSIAKHINSAEKVSATENTT